MRELGKLLLYREKKIHSTVIEGVGNFAAGEWPGGKWAIPELTHMRHAVRHARETGMPGT